MNITTSFSYNKKTINCKLQTTWKTGKDTGKAVTSVTNGSGKYPLGAYCNAYKKGSLLGGDHVVAFDTASVSIKYTSDKFTSVHNIQNSNRVPLKSSNLSLTN